MVLVAVVGAGRIHPPVIRSDSEYGTRAEMPGFVFSYDLSLFQKGRCGMVQFNAFGIGFPVRSRTQH